MHGRKQGIACARACGRREPQAPHDTREELKRTGHAGYAQLDMDVVRQRTKALYGEGMERVVPAEITAAAENAKREHIHGGPLVWDKNAAPAETAHGWATFD